MGILALAVLAWLQADPAVERIADDLAHCGVARETVAVAYADDLQDYSARFTEPLPDAAIDCLAATQSLDPVVFEFTSWPQTDRYNEAVRQRPDVVARLADLRASQTEWLAERGLLDRLPRYHRGGDLNAYAAGLERLCGLRPGQFIGVDEDRHGLRLEGAADHDQLTCLITALAVSEPDSQGVAVWLTGQDSASTTTAVP